MRAFPLIWISLGFLSGIVLASALALPALIWAVAAGLAITLLGLSYRKAQGRLADWRPWLALLCALLLGAGRYQLTQAPPTSADIAYYVDTRVSLVGQVLRPPVHYDAYTEYWIESEYLVSSDGERTPVSGRVQVRFPLDAAWTYGDRLRLEGALESPPGGEDFSYADYLARFEVNAVMAFPNVRYVGRGGANPVLAALYWLRAGGQHVVYRLYPDPEASLLAGILLGDESGLSQGLKDAYNVTGLRHIIAISGFNITIIAGLLLAGFSRWLGRRRGA